MSTVYRLMLPLPRSAVLAVLMLSRAVPVLGEQPDGLKDVAGTKTPATSFELSSRNSIRMDLAYKAIGDQIDAKHARESNASGLEPLWQASFWRFIPFVPGGPSKIVEDPFVTPNYLLLSYRQLDRGVVVSQRQSLFDWVRNGTRRNR